MLEDVRVHGWRAGDEPATVADGVPFKLLSKAPKLAAPHLDLAKGDFRGRHVGLSALRPWQHGSGAGLGPSFSLAQELTGRLGGLARDFPDTLGVLLASSWDALSAAGASTGADTAATDAVGGGWPGFCTASLGAPGGARESVLEGHAAQVNCCCYCSSVIHGMSGSRLVTGSHDKTVRVWDPEVCSKTHACTVPLCSHSRSPCEADTFRCICDL